MSDFRPLDDKVIASPQMTAEDLESARALGVTTVVNNRPDGESPGDPQGPEIEAAARKLGMDYIAIPISQAGFSLPQIDSMADVLDKAEGKILAYCRSGTRSTLLWAMAQAKLGMPPEEIAEKARTAGYDIAPVRPTIDMLAAQTAD